MNEQQDQDHLPSLTLRRIVSGPCNIEAGASAWASAFEPHSAAAPIPRIVSRAPTRQDMLLDLPTVQDRIDVLDYRWQLVESLPFELAFPTQTHLDSVVHAVAFDPLSCCIASSSHGRVAVWHKPTARSAWKVHSSFVVAHSAHTLDFRHSRIVAGGDALSLWDLDESAALPLWAYVAGTSSGSRIVMTKLSPSSDLLATVEQCSSFFGAEQLLRRSETILFTETIDGVFRIWGCVIDEPDRFSLWASLDIASGLNRKVPLMTKRLRGHPMARNVETEARAREASTTDEFLVIFTDGSAASILVAVSAELPRIDVRQRECSMLTFPERSQNFDARPPACLVQSAGAISGVTFATEDLPCLRYTLLLDISNTQCIVVGRNTRGVVAISGIVHFSDMHSSMEHSMSTKNPTNLVGFVGGLISTHDGDATIAWGSARRVQTWNLNPREDMSKAIVADIEIQPTGHCVAWQAGKKSRLRMAVLDVERLRVYELGPGVRSRLLAEQRVLSSAPFSSFVVAQSSCNDETVLLNALSEDLTLFSWNVDGCSIRSASPFFIASKWPTFAKFVFLAASTSTPSSGAPIEHKLVLIDDEGTLVILKAPLSIVGPVQWLDNAQYSVSRSQPSAAAVSPDGLVALVAPLTQQSSNEHPTFELSFWDERSSDPWSFQRFRLSENETHILLSWSYDGRILAVGSPSRVRIFGAQRIDAYGNRSGWGQVASIAVTLCLRGQLSHMCWSARGLMLSSRDYLCFYDLTLTTGEALLKKVDTGTSPLPLSHPHLLRQALLQGRFEAVMSILAGLASYRNREGVVADAASAARSGLCLHELFISNHSTDNIPSGKAASGVLSALTSRGPVIKSARAFTEEALGRVLLAARERSIDGLTDSEHDALALVARTAYLVQGKQRTMDLNGLRYLVALQSLTLEKEREPRLFDGVNRLANRYIVPAFHSKYQTILVEETGRIVGAKNLDWAKARSLGMFMWIRDPELLTAQMEVVGRTEYMSPNQANKDPITAMLFFLAIGKKNAVTTFWRQASGHADQKTVLKFLFNDFELARWKTAARKNAFALLSKRRFAFFLLGDSLKDAVNVCLRQLDDFQLAIAISRAYEGDCGPVLKDVIEHTLVPFALHFHSRWLASWSFWMMNDRRLAARALVLPLGDLFQRTSIAYSAPRAPPFNDPYLAVLYQQIREPVETLEGTTGIISESDVSPIRSSSSDTQQISLTVSMQFVLRMARNFRRMGCHLLALDLVLNYSFSEQAVLSSSRKIATNQAFDAKVPATRRLALGGDDNDRSGVGNDIQATGVIARSANTSQVVTPQPDKPRKVVINPPEFDMSAFF
ncbi:BQ2448_3434 [Microbotryum intermedium]|uniref:BQ2448_3434 protein n=1 Tax=Microbotryum intermedium TaxID=269621 RepID=A0A238F9Z5_9BASI|nr:BQ2448_3434 [Microbotryum intermedium]